ncbi:MAG: hypothetical protein CVU56_26770 [Deltaproteobacteria bacterium HGW-Deltaproteobacteria-14]|jgi:hypothetical protein|nr:MAG: hypothetical protein CVU56_26770 [Deltaproteobacteria bacterium HGW-Deltaproteobacteria-14]
MSSRPHLTDDERRARLVARHHLARTAPDVVAAVRGVVAQHSSDPITPHLAAWARVPGLTTADVERALYGDRALWRLHAMRRTLFVVPTEDAPIFDAAAGRDVAVKERKRIEGWLAAALPDETDLRRWLDAVEARVEALLDDGVERRTAELSAAIPELATALTMGSGKWRTEAPLASRLMMVLALEGRVARTHPAGSWRSSQYHWTSGARFCGRDGRFGRARPLDPAAARAEIARRYLATHSPATALDLRWWTGWTAKQATAALAAVRATEVGLDGGGTGFVLAGDVGATATARHVALLPGLDSTTMGWKGRDWYLGSHAGPLFDTNGNAGPTVWVDGHVVGGWGQRPDGEVVHRLLEDVGAEAAARVGAEAAALTAWMAGTSATPRFRTPLERELSS